MQLAGVRFADGHAMPGEFAFCIPDPTNRVCMGKNLNPQLAWNDISSGTKSFALICHDLDAPSNEDGANREGLTVTANLPRADFFHWAPIDLPAAVHCLNSGKFSLQETSRGKTGSQARHGARQGINNYNAWLSGDNDMRGDYYGHEGTCPPWNDEIVHRHALTLRALDIAHAPPEVPFGGREVRDVTKGHDLAEAAPTGSYTLNSQPDYV